MNADKRDLSGLIQYIPMEKRDAAEMILNEITFLQKPLAQIKKQVENSADPASIRSYDTLCKRYSALIKQAVDFVPKTAARQAADALEKFNRPSVYDERGLLIL